MNTNFKDHFSSVASNYASSRPSYPPELFSWLAHQCTKLELAWDCGTGNGQAAIALVKYFKQVQATDASTQQLTQAFAHPQINYRVASAENSFLGNQSVDLVVVAQAVHWFDLNGFYAEVKRVLKPNGLIAVWSYAALRVEDARINAVINHFYHNIIGAYWPPERRWVESGYRDLPFPFIPLPTPNFFMHARWNLEQLLGYFRSWSATHYFIQDKGVDPTHDLKDILNTYWEDSQSSHLIEWPINILVGHLPH